MNRVHQQLTDEFVESLKQGVKPFQSPWDNSVDWGIPVNAYTGRPYQGTNILILWAAQKRCGFSGRRWMTYRQAKTYAFENARERGVELIKHSKSIGEGYYVTDSYGDSIGGVREGATGVKCLTYQVRENSEEGDQTNRARTFARWFTLFNLDQIEGACHLNEISDVGESEVLDNAQTLLCEASKDITFRTEGVRAYFSRTHNLIVTPPKARFDSENDFYAVAMHELVHATGAASRLNREVGTSREDPQYAFEELVAEIGSSFLMARLGLKGQLIDHPNYINGWISRLENDSKALQRAASLADQAVTFIFERYGAPAIAA